MDSAAYRLPFVIENCFISAVTDLPGNNHSVMLGFASHATSLCTREARLQRSICFVGIDYSRHIITAKLLNDRDIRRVSRVLGSLVQRELSRARRVTEGLLGINVNRLCFESTDLPGNNPSVMLGFASHATSLCTREARSLRIAPLEGNNFSGHEMICYYGKIIESTMIPEESPASLAFPDWGRGTASAVDEGYRNDQISESAEAPG